MGFIFNLIPGWLIAIVIFGIVGYIWIIFNAASKAEQEKQANAEKRRKYWDAYQKTLKGNDKTAALEAGRIYYLNKKMDKLSERLNTNRLSTLAGQGDIIGYGDSQQQSIEDEQKIQNDLMAMDLPNKIIANELPQNFAPSEPAQFKGSKELSNDAYKLYLLDAYSIKKNDVLEKFVCRDKIFPTVDDAIAFAASEEKKIDDELKRVEIERLQAVEASRLAEEELKASEQKKNENWTRQLKEEARVRQEQWLKGAPARLAAEKKKKRFIWGAILMVAIGILIQAYINYPKIFDSLLHGSNPWANVSYQTVKAEKLKDGWKVLPQRSNSYNNFGNPDVQYCERKFLNNGEDAMDCMVEFVNPKYPNKELLIKYSICKNVSWCTPKDAKAGMYKYESDSIISKKEANEKFQAMDAKSRD